ncbi:MAG: cob(I)yrinic acid a,c-diamide adenosyltransferase [Candidatus Nomurabacteria bacterium]|nr:cob(I)yrinic acid a,c-diamide adenosyltransferase [Candidatus Nomurabacteria bacterium]
MLYTRKGDNGTTKTFGCDQRISKSSAIAEALGSMDEINSFLGLVKVKAATLKVAFTLDTGEIKLAETIDRIQQDLFIIQAELAGADKTIVEEKVKWLEEIIDGIEKMLPPIKTFFVSGGTELASLCDIARTIARRAERRVVGVAEEQKNRIATPENQNQNHHPVSDYRDTPPPQGGEKSVNPQTLAYLNRLSSVLYAFARASNHVAGIVEEAPRYE